MYWWNTFNTLALKHSHYENTKRLLSSLLSEKIGQTSRIGVGRLLPYFECLIYSINDVERQCS